MSDKRKAWVKVLWTAAGVLMLLLLFAVVAHISAKSGLDRYRARLAAAGEELSLEKLIPPPVPEELNSASMFQEVITLLDSYPSNCLDTVSPPAMRMVVPGKAMIGWRQPDARDFEVTVTWAEVELALDERAGAIDLLHRMSSRPCLAFELDYHDGFRSLMRRLVYFKRLAQLLSAATVIELSRSNVPAAIAHNQALYSILNAWTNEPIVISSLVRMACAAIGFNATWEILQAPVVDDSALAALQSNIERVDFIDAAEWSLIGERTFISMNAANLRGSNSPFSSMSLAAAMGAGAGGGNWYEELWDITRLRAKETLWKVAYSYTDELRALQGCAVLINGVRSVRTNAPFVLVRDEIERELEALGLSAGELFDVLSDNPADIDPRSFISSSISSLNRTINRLMAVEAQRRLVITAIALKRYQQKHGQYPPELSALVPDFLKEVPADPADGDPLRYRVEPDGGYTLYSVGENGTDEGGDPSPEPPSNSTAWQRGRDWVWPRRATEAEVGVYWRR
ncbi:MAG TPA: hypothetical protein PKH32_07850 [Verrucomicrobiota bacterium]|nr:hypothetical protein [Verrucomicrobiota bacterium]